MTTHLRTTPGLPESYRAVQVTTKHNYVINHKYLWICAGPAPPGPAPGRAVYHYRATAAFSAREEWEYWDSQWRTRQGACNGLVGTGSRIVKWTARLRATYNRIAGFDIHQDGVKFTPGPARQLHLPTQSQ